MNEHTKEPWFVVEHPNGEWTIQAGQPGGGECVARRYGLSNKANARLIAAAPTLLAACEGMLHHIDDVLDDKDLTQRRAALVAAIRSAKDKR
jgi:hypothetical protein